MKRPDFQIPVYSSGDFTWKGKRGLAEASELVGPLRNGLGYWAGSKVWNDSVDVGFYVVSERTGAKLLFTYIHDEDGYDGEMQVYGSEDFVITVIND